MSWKIIYGSKLYKLKLYEMKLYESKLYEILLSPFLPLWENVRYRPWCRYFESKSNKLARKDKFYRLSRKAWLLTTTLVFPLFSNSLVKKREEEKENEVAKIVIKDHAFLLDQVNKNLTQRLNYDTKVVSYSNILTDLW